MCTVKLRHKDKSVKCRFFVEPGDVQVLHGMPDIKLLSILRATCDVISEAYENRTFGLQTIETYNHP